MLEACHIHKTQGVSYEYEERKEKNPPNLKKYCLLETQNLTQLQGIALAGRLSPHSKSSEGKLILCRQQVRDVISSRQSGNYIVHTLLYLTFTVQLSHWSQVLTSKVHQSVKMLLLWCPRGCCLPRELQPGMPRQGTPSNPDFHIPQQIYPKNANKYPHLKQPLPGSYSIRQPLHRPTTRVWTKV